MPLKTGSKNTFVVRGEKEYFRLKVFYDDGRDITGKRIVLNIGSQTIDTVLPSDGLVEVELNENDTLTAQVDLYLKEDQSSPSESFTAQVGDLDPIDTLSGVQGRCNLLGFDCGTVDGINGSKTKAGVRDFQYEHDLEVDGIAGKKTKAK